MLHIHCGVVFFNQTPPLDRKIIERIRPCSPSGTTLEGVGKYEESNAEFCQLNALELVMCKKLPLRGMINV